MTANIIHPVQGRDPHAGRRVAVYRNLHKGAWSIKALDGPHKGTVVAHAQVVGLLDCAMHVRIAAQQRIAAGAAREVHAWIVGRLSEVTLDQPTRLVYRPHERPEFYLAITGRPVHTAAAVLFTDHAYVNAA
ncbi:hypothetical protein [Mycobacterium dioxanotrophicus]|nr:hypothetical protein [Mycobacterium dioxanotrophicus]